MSKININRNVQPGIKFRFVALWLFLIISFICIGSALVFSALGYEMDWRNLKFYKTGLIYLKIQPPDSQIFLDGKPVSLSRRDSLSELLPGRYELEIKKADYQTWSASVEVRGGFATIYENIQLFLKEPVIQPASQTEANALKALEKPDGIQIIDKSEIRIIQGEESQLVTRFSFPIEQARWHPDRRHISYIAQGELRIIELNGANNMLLLKLGDAVGIEYYFQDKNTVIFGGAAGAQKAMVQ